MNRNTILCRHLKLPIYATSFITLNRQINRSSCNGGDRVEQLSELTRYDNDSHYALYRYNGSNVAAIMLCIGTTGRMLNLCWRWL